jgi:anhydro-N-acetylmuramic acid kinase
MVYRAIGLMSGSSLDGLDIVYAELHENAGKWSFEIIAADCYTYNEEWKNRLQNAESLNALDYQLLHTDYGHYLGNEVNRFIQNNNIQYKVNLVASHGHTTFHLPKQKMTGQLGDGAAIAAETRLAVVSDLRALDVAFGGQGAPIVPIGEKLLLSDYSMFLNIGGIANVSFNLSEIDSKGGYVAFDVCPANRVLNLIANKSGKEYDEGGQMATSGNVHHDLLQKLNEQDYYKQSHPKSLANTFGTDVLYPLIETFELTPNDKLRTYVEHIVQQVKSAVQQVLANEQETANLSSLSGTRGKLLVTGGGAFNNFLISRLSEELHPLNIEVKVPDEKIVQYKEALIMAFIGVLRWRQEYNVLASVTGAERDSINGALWMGQEA